MSKFLAHVSGKTLLTVAAVLLTLSVSPRPAQAAFDYSVYHSNIGCDEIAAGRAQEICKAISDSLEWHFFGHHVIAIGFWPTKEGIAKAYRDLGITSADIATLQALKKYGRDYDWRLEDGVDGLVRILNIETGGHFMEEEGTVKLTD